MATRMSFYVEITTREDDTRELRQRLEQELAEAALAIAGVEQTSMANGNIADSPHIHYHSSSPLEPRYRARVTLRATGSNETFVARHAQRQMGSLGWCGNGFSFGNRTVESTRVLERPKPGDPDDRILEEIVQVEPMTPF